MTFNSSESSLPIASFPKNSYVSKSTSTGTGNQEPGARGSHSKSGFTSHGVQTDPPAQNPPGIESQLQIIGDSIEELTASMRSVAKLGKTIRRSTRSKKPKSAKRPSPKIIVPPPPSDIASDSPRSSVDSPREASDIASKDRPPSPIKTTVRFCNWYEFKNIFEKNEPVPTIEGLISEPNLQRQIHGDYKEFYKVRPNQWRTSKPNEDAYNSDTPPGSLRRLQRLRINSKALVRFFSSLGTETEFWDNNAVTFCYPFRWSIYYHEKIKEKLGVLEKELEQFRKTKSNTIETDGVLSIDYKELSTESTDLKEVTKELGIEGADSKTGTIDSSEHVDPVLDADNQWVDEDDGKQSSRYVRRTQVLLEHIKCYIEVVESNILPAYHAVRNQPKLSMISYRDLPYFFKIGDLIYDEGANEAKEDRGQGSNTEQCLLRIHYIHTPFAEGHFFNSDGDCEVCSGAYLQNKSDEAPNVSWTFYVQAYYIDHDGNRYGARSARLAIRPFEGEREITKLGFYPTSYLDDQDMVSDAIEHGRNFKALMESKFGFYRGWTLSKSPSGEVTERKGPTFNIEHIDSDVIIDFSEALNQNPAWRPALRTRPIDTHLVKNALDSMPTSLWSDPSRYDRLAQSREVLITADDVSRTESKEFEEADKFISSQQLSPPMTPEDLCLLPRRLFAYALWQRRFVMVDSNSRFLRTRNPDVDQIEPFELLQIPQDAKDLIESLIDSHFDKKDAEQEGIEAESQDIIKGKGNGVVILLHGAPGVGKTATAEAVSQKWNRPLFPITCGDLGPEADDVESNLEHIFRLAHLWNCILLLDEADVFISQRDLRDVDRNAKVSVFLRALEYYNGILFLTTNRVGVLDEAVKSRVHLNLLYDYLTEQQTLAIFKTNIDRLIEAEKKRSEAKNYQPLIVVEEDILRFARDHYRQYESNKGVGRWNGRQIRNSFLIAASLAHFKAKKMSKSIPNYQKRLEAEQFRTVAKTTLDFDKYRAGVIRSTDEKEAASRGERLAYSAKAPNVTPSHEQAGPGSQAAFQNFQPPMRQPSFDMPIQNAGYMPPPQDFYGRSSLAQQSQLANMASAGNFGGQQPQNAGSSGIFQPGFSTQNQFGM